MLWQNPSKQSFFNQSSKQTQIQTHN